MWLALWLLPLKLTSRMDHLTCCVPRTCSKRNLRYQLIRFTSTCQLDVCFTSGGVSTSKVFASKTTQGNPTEEHARTECQNSRLLDSVGMRKIKGGVRNVRRYFMLSISSAQGMLRKFPPLRVGIQTTSFKSLPANSPGNTGRTELGITVSPAAGILINSLELWFLGLVLEMLKYI